MKNRPVYRLYQMAWASLDWLYPPRCGGCGRASARWCSDCERSIRLLPENVCDLCGQPYGGSGMCVDCQAFLPRYAALRSWASFEGSLRQALHCLKYKGDVALGEILARPLVRLLQELSWVVDLVVPVPIGVARRAERGYNQAALLAFPVALGCDLPYKAGALRKVRETLSQVGLGADQRHENVAGAFQANQRLVSNRSVLVVDDVTTSGATMQACTDVLLQAGAKQVYGLTLARAGLQLG